MRCPRSLTWKSSRPRYSIVAVGAPAREVARAVQRARARSARRERIGDESLGGELRPVVIAEPHLHAAEVQLARHADRQLAQRAHRARSSRVFAIGRPIGTTAGGVALGGHAHQLTSTAHSVGPYRLCSARRRAPRDSTPPRDPAPAPRRSPSPPAATRSARRRAVERAEEGTQHRGHEVTDRHPARAR